MSIENNLPNYFLLCFSAAREESFGNAQRCSPAPLKNGMCWLPDVPYKHFIPSGMTGSPRWR